MKPWWLVLLGVVAGLALRLKMAQRFIDKVVWPRVTARCERGPIHRPTGST